MSICDNYLMVTADGIRSPDYRAGVTGNGVGEGKGVAVVFVMTRAAGVTGELVSNPRAVSIQSCIEGFSG